MQRHVKPQCFRRLEVDRQFEPRRLNHRQVRRFSSIENAADIDSRLNKRIDTKGGVTDQTASPNKLGPFVHDWDRVAGSKRHQFIALNLEEQLSAHKQCASTTLD